MLYPTQFEQPSSFLGPICENSMSNPNDSKEAQAEAESRPCLSTGRVQPRVIRSRFLEQPLCSRLKSIVIIKCHVHCGCCLALPELSPQKKKQHTNYINTEYQSAISCRVCRDLKRKPYFTTIPRNHFSFDLFSTIFPLAELFLPSPPPHLAIFNPFEFTRTTSSSCSSHGVG